MEKISQGFRFSQKDFYPFLLIKQLIQLDLSILPSDNMYCFSYDYLDKFCKFC